MTIGTVQTEKGKTMRLIDADAIPYVKTMYTVGLLDMVTRFTIDTMPTIDAVPVVRCKDCKYWKLSQYNTMGIHICGRFSGVRGEHDFCSRGERRDNA